MEAEKEAALDLSDAEKHDIIEMRNTPHLYNKMVESVCPSVFGHLDVKRGVLLMLFGGVQKTTPEGPPPLPPPSPYLPYPFYLPPSSPFTPSLIPFTPSLIPYIYMSLPLFVHYLSSLIPHLSCLALPCHHMSWSHKA